MKPASALVSHLRQRAGLKVARRLAGAAIILAIAWMPLGCAGMKKRAEERRKTAAERNQKREPRLIGMVQLVNAEGGFVLIDCGTNPAPAPEGNLRCKTGDVESAELKVSEIRRHPFVIADIVKGKPNKGDMVYQ